jgi:hypothetical protein
MVVDHRNHVHDFDPSMINLMEDHHAWRMNIVEMPCFSQHDHGLSFNDVEKTTILNQTVSG